MKPKTQYQKAVAALIERLPPLSSREKKKIWSLMTQIARVFNAQHNTCYCDICGGAIHSDTNPTVCPHCFRKIDSEHGRHSDYWMYSSKVNRRYVTSASSRESFTQITTCSGWQVVRTFLCRLYKQRKKKAELYCVEVGQWWISPDGHFVLASRPGSICGINDYWSLYGAIEVRSKSCLYSDSSCRYPLGGASHHNQFGKIITCRLLPVVKRNGLTSKLVRQSAHYPAVIMNCLKNHNFEAILKSNQEKLKKHLLSRMDMSTQLPPYHAVRLCCRHGYAIEDPQMWLDHISYINQLGLDSHSPHYVCPASLREQHTQLHTMIVAMRERKRQEEEKRKAKGENGAYRKAMQRFLAVRFGNEALQFHVLQDVSEFYEEGKAMHHCVYYNGYYKKRNTLILSCRDAEGKRVETVEVDTMSYRIAQSRGVNNSTTPYHNEILALVNANMHLIRIANEGGIQQNLNFAA